MSSENDNLSATATTFRFKGDQPHRFDCTVSTVLQILLFWQWFLMFFVLCTKWFVFLQFEWPCTYFETWENNNNYNCTILKRNHKLHFHNKFVCSNIGSSCYLSFWSVVLYYFLARKFNYRWIALYLSDRDRK